VGANLLVLDINQPYRMPAYNILVHTFTLSYFSVGFMSKHDQEHMEENRQHGDNVHKFLSSTLHSVRSVSYLQHFDIQQS